MATGNINESQILFQLLNANTDKTNSKCNQFFALALCFYLFRSCELRNVSDPTSGSQITICREKCAGVDKLYQECYNKDNTVINSQDEALLHLASLTEGFTCSDPDTYIIPQVPVSNRLCNDISYIDHLLPTNKGRYIITVYYSSCACFSFVLPLKSMHNIIHD